MNDVIAVMRGGKRFELVSNRGEPLRIVRQTLNELLERPHRAFDECTIVS